jgi:DNA replication initiation complex subunit (GINS family)
VFITPEVNHNKLLEHAQTKQKEVKSWGLSIISDDFTVLIKDADFFAAEINQLQLINGEKLIFDDVAQMISSHAADKDLSDYENNINRKNKIRCSISADATSEKLIKINQLTSKNWLEGEGFIRKIESIAPKIYHHLVRVINQYEDEVSEISLTWSGSAEELTEKVKESLFHRLKDEIPEMSSTDQRKVANHMIAKWLALCPLDFE